jgi:hypothetical protein
VDGLEVVKNEIVGCCEDCILVNMKRRPFDDEVIPEKVALRQMNIDIWGPSHVPSEGGVLYAMKFHDSGTSHRRSFFLKDRTVETMLNALKIYKLESEKVTGMKMVYVQTDNAPEFKGSIWATFLNDNGIIHIPTAPYSSASNGTAEHSIGISMAAVRAMLKDSGLPIKWWAEAWAFMDYAENLLPLIHHLREIPEEKWTGIWQDIGHLRIWGCVAYVYVPKEHGGSKLSDRGQKGKLIGIEGWGLYKILIPEMGIIVRLRNVVFKEGLGHRTLMTEGELLVDDNNIDTEFPTDPTPADPTSAVESTLPNLDTTVPPTEPTNNQDPVQCPPRPQIVYPPATWKSSRNIIPSQVAIESGEYKSRESNAANNRSEWATDNLIPIVEDGDEDESHTALAATDFPPEPKNLYVPNMFGDAFDQACRHLWYPAMVREIQHWDDRGVVTPVPCPPNIKTIKMKWVFDLKLNRDGELIRRRARGVIKGFTQKLGEHYFESFAAVVRYDSVRMLFTIIAA